MPHLYDTPHPIWTSPNALIVAGQFSMHVPAYSWRLDQIPFHHCYLVRILRKKKDRRTIARHEIYMSIRIFPVFYQRDKNVLRCLQNQGIYTYRQWPPLSFSARLIISNRFVTPNKNRARLSLWNKVRNRRLQELFSDNNNNSKGGSSR